MGSHAGRHRATRSTVQDRLKARSTQRRLTLPAAALAGIAVAGSAVLGVAPAMTTAPELLAQAFYLRGTNIGTVPPDDVYAAFADDVIAHTAGDHDAAQKVPYPGGFWPISKGYFADPTYDDSVAQGLAGLTELTGDETGVVIYGFSQGAVVATGYKRATGAVGNSYVLVANPNRPNGGILQRFNGLSIPILEITFTGATPTDGDVTYDIARQYDGWADFPKHPGNLLATANAVLGILYLHGKYERDIDPAVLDDPTKTDKSVHDNTTYYLIHTDRLPLLMPFEGIVPENILAALDPALRVLVEFGYDRTNYGQPTTAAPEPAVNQFDLFVDLATAITKGIDIGLAGATPSVGAPAAVSAATPPAAAPEPAVDEKPATIDTPDASPERAPRPARTSLREDRPSSTAPDATDAPSDDGDDASDTKTGDDQGRDKDDHTQTKPKPERKMGNRDAGGRQAAKDPSPSADSES